MHQFTPQNHTAGLVPVAGWLLAAAVALAGAARAGADTPAWQPHEEIRQAAAAAAQAAAGGGGPAEVVADSPDPRLRLPRCDRALTAAMPGATRPSGRLTAEVSCAGSRPWRLYLPVRITANRPIVVAARSLARDTVLAPADIRLAKVGASTATYGAVSELSLAVGKKLRRGLDEGAPLTASLLDAPVIIRRGQQVTVEALASGFAVRMAGVARADGSLGEVIDVESDGSGKVVQAIVRSAKSVEVLLR